MAKPKVAISWNSSCGGCDEAIVDIEEKVLDVAAAVEFVLWPCAMDFKYAGIESMKDGEIAVSLINGGIQNTHQERVVKLLRKKSALVVAFGSCACLGGVPSLANLTSMKDIFAVSYATAPTVVNPEGTVPLPESSADGHALTLPRMFDSLLKLDDVIGVDYYLPGCPPTAAQIGGALEAILKGELPAKGSVLVPNKSLCTSCSRNDTKPDTVSMARVRRIHEVEADPALCFLAQEILCMGPATRDGCEYPCVKGNMPCTGCTGPVAGADQGAKMIGVLGGILGGSDDAGADEALEGIVDPAGTFYRYCTSASLLGRRRPKDTV